MSLYNNVAAAAKAGTISGFLRGKSGSLLDRAAGALTGALGGSAVANAVTSAARTFAGGYADQVAGQIAARAGRFGRSPGDVGAMLGFAGGLPGMDAQAAFYGEPTPLLGGVSPAEAKRIIGSAVSERYARRNLWLIEVSAQGAASITPRFNLFATELDYAPFTITGEKRRVGGAMVDVVQGNEAVEMRITTMDDEAGTLKRWFANQHAMVSAEDGTVGVPANYAVTIKVVHAFTARDIANGVVYEDYGLFRPANLDITLSRRESAMQELQMTFTQLDTFARPR